MNSNTHLQHPKLVLDQSVTNWIVALRDGDHIAAQNLWTFLRRRLVSHAERRVDRAGSYDEEDVALSAFGVLCAGIQEGRYDEIDNRDDLWRLLAVITTNKARKRALHENRVKRGGKFSRIADEEAFFETVTSVDPPPDLVISMQEECERMLNLLGQDELKMVVLLKVEGYTNEEIGKAIGCTRRSVQRRLALVKNIWTEDSIEAEQ